MNPSEPPKSVLAAASANPGGPEAYYLSYTEFQRYNALQNYPPKWKGTVRYGKSTADVSLRVVGGPAEIGTIAIRSVSKDDCNIIIRKKVDTDVIWTRHLVEKFAGHGDEMTTVLALPLEGNYRSFNKLYTMSDYLRLRKLAGVVECSSFKTTNVKHVAYFFPKDKFTVEHMELLDPVLTKAISEEPYLVIIFDNYWKPLDV